jgi:integrase/recombinase XerD
MRIVMDQTLTSAEAEKLGYISIADAVAKGLTAKHRTTLNREAKTGTIPSCWVTKGSRPVLWVLKEALDKNLPNKTVSSYERLEAQWINKMRDGTFGGKPFSESTIETRQWGLNKYWSQLGVPKTVQDLNAKNFEIVMGKFAHNTEAQKDSFASKEQVFKAVTGFLKFLIKEGLKSNSEREKIQELLPKARYAPKKKVVEDYEIVEAIEQNKKWRKARTDYDIMVLDLLIHLYGYAGLRRSEAIDLRRENIFFKDKVIKVFGKNHKERFVTPHPKIWPTLEDWVNQYCKDSRTGFLILNKQGKKYTKRCISDKFQSFSLKIEKDVYPHDLRRGFAVLMANLGMPLGQIQIILGHEDIKTTMGYVMTNYKHAQKWVAQNLAVPDTLEESEADASDDEMLDALLTSE